MQNFTFDKLRPIVLLSLVAIIPVLFASIFMGRFVLNEQRAAVDNQLHQNALLSARGLARELEMQVELLNLVAESPRLDPPISRAAFRELIPRLKARNPLWYLIHVADQEGNILLAEPDSRQLKSPPQVRDRPSFERVVTERKPAVGNIVKGEQAVATFPVRLPLERKGLTYILSALIRPEKINDILFENGLPSTWTAWIVDGQGRLVAATQAPRAAIGETAEKFIRIAPPPPAGEALTAHRMDDGSTLRAAATVIPGSNWTVNLGMPQADYYDIGRTRYYWLIFAVVLFVVLFLFTGYLLQREITDRLRQSTSVGTLQRMDALGKLSGGVAHDFNNLLMVFQAGVESLRKRRGDERRFGMTLEMMAEGVARGRVITERLLAFSRETNRDATVVRIQDRVAEFRQLVKQASRDNIEVELTVDPDLWPVYVDPLALEIALINLVTNAREAMPNGGIIRISARNVNDGWADTGQLRGPVVALTVSDDGPGIKAADLPRVFEPFFTTKKGKASGLGLAQVYGFAKRSGGAAVVGSLEGRGTAISIFLPPTENKPLSSGEKAAEQVRLPRRVLVVDDTPSSLEACRMSLELEGVLVATASSGDEALSILAADASVPLVLSDIMMPNMSGYELFDKIKDGFPQVAVVLMTGYSSELEEGASIGCPVIRKPFTTAELLKAVHQTKEPVQGPASSDAIR